MKTIVNLTALLFLIGFISCETDVPDTNTTPPSFSLRITGDSFDRTFTQDDDLNNIQINLRVGVS